MFENLIINKDVNKIEVTNVWSQKNDVNKSYAGAKAIIYPKKGNAYVEDWTDKLTRDFCLNKESSRSENIKSITLVLSNAGISEGFPAGSFIVQGKKNSKDCKKEEKKTGKYIIQGSDTRLRTETTLDVKTGGTYEIKTTCTFTVTGKQVGGGLGAKIPEYQWVDKYAVSYKHTCNSSWPYGTASDVKTGSGFIDLTVSFALLYSLSDPNPSADIENSTESYSSVDGFGNKDSGTRKEGTAYYGWLENYTKNGTEIHFNFYDWDTDYTDGTKLDHSDVIIKVIGQ